MCLQKCPIKMNVDTAQVFIILTSYVTMITEMNNKFKN